MNTNTSLFASKKFILFIIGAVLALIIAGGLIAASKRDPIKDNLQRATLRYANLVDTTRRAKDSIGNSDLRKLNSEVNIFLSSGSTALYSQLATRYGTKIPKEMTASETDSTTAGKLYQASLLGQYDTVYHQTLTQKIESLDALLIEMIGQTKSQQLLATLKEAQGNTSTLITQLRALKI